MSHDWSSHYAENAEPWTTPDAVLVDETEGLAPGKALDLGCGEGADCIWLAEKGWAVTGVDYARAALATMEQMALEKGVMVGAVAADIFEWEPDDEYDLVFICFIHVRPEERKKLLALASSALAPGGTLLYIGISRSGDAPEADIPGELLAVPSDVAADLPDLEIERTEMQNRTIGYPGGSFEGNTMLVRARRPDGA